MNAMQKFVNENLHVEIRVVTIDGQAWMVGKDAATALGYSNSRKALADHVSDADKLYEDGVTIRDSIGREQKAVLINEYGFLSLVMRSNLPYARQIQHWVTHEVLPSVLHTGMYINTNALMATPESAEAGAVLMEQNALFLRNWISEQKKREEAERQLALAAPKVKKYDQFMTADGCLVKEFAATLCKNGVTHILLNGKLMTAGQNHLFASLREHKFLCSAHGKRYNLPMQKWIDAGYFTVKTNSVEMSGAQRQTTTTIITPAGQAYLLDFYKEMTK